MTDEEQVAEAAIRRTINRYNLAGDRGMLEELAATFTEDGKLCAPMGTHVGRAAIASGLGANSASRSVRPRFVRHHLTTSRIDLLDGARATGRHYFLVLTEIGLDRAGYYKDSYRRVGEKWLIERRDVRLDFIADNSRMPRPPGR